MASPTGKTEARLTIAPQRGQVVALAAIMPPHARHEVIRLCRALVRGYVDIMLLAWFRKRREAEQRATERAERLIRDLGDGAYSEARRSEREALDLETAAHWRRVALIVASMRGKRVGLDTASRLEKDRDRQR